MGKEGETSISKGSRGKEIKEEEKEIKEQKIEAKQIKHAGLELCEST